MRAVDQHRPSSVRDWRRKPPLRLTITHKPRVCWWWIKCAHCPHMAAVAIAPYVIRWRPDGWQEVLHRHGRCSACGKRGVALQHPSWDSVDTGLAAMPIDQMAPVP